MIGRKYTIVLWLSLIVVLIGILKVNIEINRINGKAYDEETYKNVYSDSDHRADAYAEITLDNKRGVQLRMYYTAEPFDLRFSIGNKVIYINKSIFNGKKEETKVSSQQQ
ncbi:MAG: hypothetical protein GX895_02385 [Clostridiales bacterium]|uniref:hypothetical protein n=1 Tax=Clostridium sp. N3C TaxID=1776758 RepID=UPI00092E1A5E|nr:hypothetical protein [Clostridium sp. N3C]NLZ47631.1 hypothetical protein [Clostridiales bacterium]SCN21760.1 hypothetical protein N3C_0419 [Clostridium sp. N3C]